MASPTPTYNDLHKGQIFWVWNPHHRVAFNASLREKIREAAENDGETWTCAPCDLNNPTREYGDTLIAKFTSRRPNPPWAPRKKFFQHKIAFEANIQPRPSRHVSPTLAYMQSVPIGPYDFLVVQLRYLPLKELLQPKGRWYQDSIAEHRRIIKSFTLVLSAGVEQFSNQKISRYEDCTMAHNDLKESNTVFDQFEKTLKLIDTGSVALLRPEKALGASSHSLTPGYSAPERREEMVTHTSDVCSLAKMVGSIVNGCKPLSDADFQKELAAWIDQDFASLLRQCHNAAPLQRPTATDVIEAIRCSGLDIEAAEECLAEFLGVQLEALPDLPLQDLPEIEAMDYELPHDVLKDLPWKDIVGEFLESKSLAIPSHDDSRLSTPTLNPIEIIKAEQMQKISRALQKAETETEEIVDEPPLKKRKLLDEATAQPEDSGIENEHGTIRRAKEDQDSNLSDWSSVYFQYQTDIRSAWMARYAIFDLHADFTCRDATKFLVEHVTESPSSREFERADSTPPRLLKFKGELLDRKALPLAVKRTKEVFIIVSKALKIWIDSRLSSAESNKITEDRIAE